MSSAESKGNRPISLDDLIALNDEIASLVRAGIPIELGLEGFRWEVSGRLGKLTDRLHTRLHNGESLNDALLQEQNNFPPAYRAVIDAGLRTGQLPDALDSLTNFSRTVMDLRRKVGLSLIYPLSVIILAFGLLVAFSLYMIPQFVDVYHLFHLPENWLIPFLQSMHDTVGIWGWLVPLLLLLMIVWWNVSSHFSISPGRGLFGGITRTADTSSTVWKKYGKLAPRKVAFWNRLMLPGITGMKDNFYRANFAEMLSILVRHSVPLHEAIILAADTTGDSRLVMAGHSIAENLQRGQPLNEAVQNQPTLPSFMRWMMSTSSTPESLAASLKQLSEVYRRRALHQCDTLKRMLPIALVVIVGGGVTLAYGLTVFFPLTELLKAMTG